ncbi:MAG: hypothetical protein II678_03480 [Erysipelotrichaceae bacterium]|nr:hypothetical protein [Erysipelotrichaceae bacterium]MBQ3962588.1 hypothetical protein [Erysipelotrichaceae bacterium]
MNYRDEILQAINAADEALYCLDQARKQLLSARNWGIFDIFGGGMVATFIKRRKMSEAKAYAKDARESLMKLKDELDDIDDVIEFDLDMDDFLSFADYFFDNSFFSDLMVQGRINNARSKILQAIDNVKQIKEELEEEL